MSRGTRNVVRPFGPVFFASVRACTTKSFASGAFDTTGNVAFDQPLAVALPGRGRLVRRFVGRGTVILPGAIDVVIMRDQREVVARVFSQFVHEAFALIGAHRFVHRLSERGRACDHGSKIDIARGKLFQHDAGGHRIGARAPRLFGKRERAQPHARSVFEKVGEQRLVERLQAGPGGSRQA